MKNANYNDYDDLVAAVLKGTYKPTKTNELQEVLMRQLFGSATGVVTATPTPAGAVRYSYPVGTASFTATGTTTVDQITGVASNGDFIYAKAGQVVNAGDVVTFQGYQVQVDSAQPIQKAAEFTLWK